MFSSQFPCNILPFSVDASDNILTARFPCNYFFFTIIAASCIFFLQRLLRRFFQRPSDIARLPSPNQGFFLFRLFHEPTVAELESWVDQLPNEGLVRYRGVFNQPRILITSPEAAKDLLYKHAYKFVKPKLIFDLAKNVVAEGLLLQEGKTHKAARRNLQPAFHTDRTRMAYPIMWKAAGDLLEVVSTQCQTTNGEHQAASGEVQLLKPAFAATLDVFGRWGLSTEFNAVKNPRSPFGRPYIELLKTTRRGQKALGWTSVIGVGVLMKLPLRAVKTIKRVVNMVVQSASDVVAKHQKWSPGQNEEKGPHMDDMLSVMMKSGHFSTQDLVVQTVHFLGAATETTSGSTSWALHLLSRHPDVQQRLRNEIRAHLPSHSQACVEGESSFEGMSYLEAVVKEALRFHSVNTILWRECVSPGAQILGIHIPIGTQVVFSPWTMNRDPKIWGPDARSFRPERWLESLNGGADHSYSFLTFGAGPRRCIGEQYAKAQMRCMLSALVGRYQFEPLASKRDAETDDGWEIGDAAALTLFKIVEGWKLRATRVDGW